MTSKDELRREIDRYKGLAHTHHVDAAHWERRFRDERAARQDADEKAEREHTETKIVLDDALSEVERLSLELEEARADVKSAVDQHAICHESRPRTPRELLDAAWDAAYVPEDGVIPKGAGYIGRDADGDIYMHSGGAEWDSAASGNDYELRLLDAPEPVKPERPVVTDRMVERAWTARLGSIKGGHDLMREVLTAALTEDGVA